MWTMYRMMAAIFGSLPGLSTTPSTGSRPPKKGGMFVPGMKSCGSAIQSWSHVGRRRSEASPRSGPHFTLSQGSPTAHAFPARFSFPQPSAASRSANPGRWVKAPPGSCHTT